MFTSNGKAYYKRDSGLSNGHGREAGVRNGACRVFDEDVLGRRAGIRNGTTRIFDEDILERRGGVRTARNFNEDTLDRRTGLRNGAPNIFDEDILDHGDGLRNGACRTFDEESSGSDELMYGKKPVFRKQQKFGGQPSFGNQLLSLRAALNDKELQLVELREQYIRVVSRAADARHNWEEALKSKDHVILQLQKALHHKKCALERQERDYKDNLQRVLQLRQKEENVEVEKKELKIALLEAKNAQFVQELVEQQKLVTKLKRQSEEKEKFFAAQVHKMDMMNGRVQDLKAALQDKEEVADTKSKYCNELKTLLWKRDSMIAQLQLAEQQLQSTLARQEAAYEALVVSRDKLQDEKTFMEKKLMELRSEFAALENAASQSSGMKGLEEKEGMLQKQHRRLREWQRSMRAKDIALNAKAGEQNQLLDENQRLIQDYDALKQECEAFSRRNYELQCNLVSLQDQLTEVQIQAAERSATGKLIGVGVGDIMLGHRGVSVSDGSTPPVEVLPYELSQSGSVGEVSDLGVDDAILGSVESEQQSTASVYHANFEKVKIVEVETPNIEPQQPPPPSSPTPVHASPPPPPSPPAQNPVSSSDADNTTLNSIQDEILKREKCWRKTEELMRAALTRRMKLLEEAKEIHHAEKITQQDWHGKPHIEEADIHLERCKQPEQDSHFEVRKHAEQDSHQEHRRQFELDNHLARRKHMEALKHIEQDSHQEHRRQFELENHLERRKHMEALKHVEQDSHQERRRRFELDNHLERRKPVERNGHHERRSYHEQYACQERSGRHERISRSHRGKVHLSAH